MTEPFNHLKLLKSGVFMGEGSSCIEHQQQGSCFNSLKVEHDPPLDANPPPQKKRYFIKFGQTSGGCCYNSHLGGKNNTHGYLKFTI